MTADTELRLSQSHRFGTRIANAANSILELRNEDVPLTATAGPGVLYRPDSQPVTITRSLGRTVIFRTNNGESTSFLLLASKVRPLTHPSEPQESTVRSSSTPQRSTSAPHLLPLA